MKYTIELTDNQKKQMDLLCELAHRYIGFNPKLEPIKTTNVEDTNEYQIGYKTGYDIAQTNAQATKEEWGKAEYKRGLEDFEKLFIYEHDYEQFFEDTYGSKDPDYNLYDLVARYGAKKVVDDFKKWQEEKKKTKEEIKVGDEVICNCPNEQRVIITSKYDGWVTFMRKDGACYSRAETDMKKTGRHFEEVQQLLSKLKECRYGK